MQPRQEIVTCAKWDCSTTEIASAQFGCCSKSGSDSAPGMPDSSSCLAMCPGGDLVLAHPREIIVLTRHRAALDNSVEITVSAEWST